MYLNVYFDAGTTKGNPGLPWMTNSCPITFNAKGTFLPEHLLHPFTNGILHFLHVNMRDSPLHCTKLASHEFGIEDSSCLAMPNVHFLIRTAKHARSQILFCIPSKPSSVAHALCCKLPFNNYDNEE